MAAMVTDTAMDMATVTAMVMATVTAMATVNQIVENKKKRIKI